MSESTQSGKGKSSPLMDPDKLVAKLTGYIIAPKVMQQLPNAVITHSLSKCIFLNDAPKLAFYTYLIMEVSSIYHMTAPSLLLNLHFSQSCRRNSHQNSPYFPYIFLRTLHRSQTSDKMYPSSFCGVSFRGSPGAPSLAGSSQYI